MPYALRGQYAPERSERLPERIELREAAIEGLRRIHYQRSVTREHSMTLKFPGMPKFPLGAEAARKQARTDAERPKSYPEIVDDFKGFLNTASRTNELIIGIDELDKLRSGDKIEDFLNDVKAIFGTPGCFYLVSVSEDAAARFERHGAPFRDVFDSSFDDVLAIGHLELESARKVLYGLAARWTEPFICLCYAMSGGLARDLHRTARQLMAGTDEMDELDLAQSVLALCRNECGARIRAVRHELMSNSRNAAGLELRDRIADIVPEGATAGTFVSWHNDLCTWATEAADRSDLRADAVPGLALPVRLALELAAFMLFAATVLSFFEPDAIGSKGPEAETSGIGFKSLATLATARQLMALSPEISLSCIRRFREEWKLAQRTGV